jgi:hypothetical protein
MGGIPDCILNTIRFIALPGVSFFHQAGFTVSGFHEDAFAFQVSGKEHVRFSHVADDIAVFQVNRNEGIDILLY